MAVIAFLSSLHTQTLVFVLVLLYAALSLVVVYTYFFRKTYPGFGELSLGVVMLGPGLYLVFYRPMGPEPSLLLGNVLLLGQMLLLYIGLARYGLVEDWRRRSLGNFVVILVGMAGITYYLFAEYDTCRRIVIYSAVAAMLTGRIALEPWLCGKWRTYDAQRALSGLYLAFCVIFVLRMADAWSRTDCVVTDLGEMTAVLLLALFLFSPLLVFCVLAMTSSRLEAELRVARDALRHEAQTDSLTGLPNRRHFLQLAEAALDRAGLEGRQLSLVMLDLDHFKQINDTHGHQAGDMVLRAVGKRLREVLDGKGVAGRLGGEEFGALLPDLSGEGAAAAARELGRAVAMLRPDGITVTASLGLASGMGNLESLLAKADVCLYAAKESGRNRLVSQEALAAEDMEGAH